MGLVKAALMEAEERGWSDKDTFVCDDCVDDLYLKSVIVRRAVSDTCSYCDRSEQTDIAAAFAEVMELIANTAYYYFGDPTHVGVPWDRGPVIDPTDTADMLASLPLDCNDKFLDDVIDAFHNTGWVEAADGHWASLHEHEVLHYSWASFVRLVKYETRFHFHTKSPSEFAEPQEVAPGKFLEVLGRVVSNVGLVRSIPTGTILFRVRIRRGDEWAADAEQLGAPPPDKARAGRMNPAGISYLYTALEAQTAIAETVKGPPVEVVIARFATVRPLTIIDLSDLPELPSIFDGEQRDLRESLLFLRAFSKEVSRPVSQDGSEHIDYVPSQVVSEYFAQVFQPEVGETRIDGMLYRSAIYPSGRNVVLFPSERGWGRKFNAVSFQGPEVRQLNSWPDILSAMKAERKL